MIISFAWNGVQTLQKNNLEKNYEICKANMASVQVAMNLAKEMQTAQERKLRLREQEAAKARVESLKRMDEIMSAEIKGGCEGAIQFLITQAKPAY